MQVLQGDWGASFSEASYGFRPGRSAHQAVERAQERICAGCAVLAPTSTWRRNAPAVSVTLGDSKRPHVSARAAQRVLRSAWTALQTIYATSLKSIEPPCTDPYARWCGNVGGAKFPYPDFTPL